ncbi:pectate lyase family protein [Sorangium sp. So ce1151]|uniref:pectate lyase family protein n=1 Tax=Sorangium sp. So ce1151 TaxID=3133332 RepID=UPI003F631E4F
MKRSVLPITLGWAILTALSGCGGDSSRPGDPTPEVGSGGAGGAGGSGGTGGSGGSGGTGGTGGSGGSVGIGGTGGDIQQPPDGPSSLGADGWAATTTGTTGGDGATEDNIFTVTTRRELVAALFPNGATGPDGTPAAPSSTPKIIYIKGTIDLSTDDDNRPLTEQDYADPAYDFQAYVDAYKPSVWNTTLVNGKPPPLTGPLEEARARSADRQKATTLIQVGSNTSILGLGADAKIIHGTLYLGAGIDNVVIRNIAFEDAFDFFPAWDPGDSFKVDTSVPGCTAETPLTCPGGRWNSEYDLVQVIGATHVWIDHNTFSDGDRPDKLFPSVFEAPRTGHDYSVQHHDGAVDVTLQSDLVTISYNRFHDHDKTNLLGGTDTATPQNGWGLLSVTLHHNLYENATQRLPRVRFGKVHVYNNYYKGTLAPPDGAKPAPDYPFLYALGIGQFAKLYSEANVFEIAADPAGPPAAATNVISVYHKAGSGDLASEKTYFFDAESTLNGEAVDLFAAAQVAALAANKPELAATDSLWTPASSYEYTKLPAAEVKAEVTAKAGAGGL